MNAYHIILIYIQIHIYEKDVKKKIVSTRIFQTANSLGDCCIMSIYAALRPITVHDLGAGTFLRRFQSQGKPWIGCVFLFDCRRARVCGYVCVCVPTPEEGTMDAKRIG